MQHRSLALHALLSLTITATLLILSQREGLGGFFRAVSGKTREEKKKKERRKDRSSSVPNRRQSAPSGVGELNFKPRPSGDSAQSPPPAPNYAQKNSNMPPDKGKDKPSDDDTQTLTFKPPSVPSMADEDDYADFVLEVKCLDTGKVEQVRNGGGSYELGYCGVRVSNVCFNVFATPPPPSLGSGRPQNWRPRRYKLVRAAAHPRLHRPRREAPRREDRAVQDAGGRAQDENQELDEEEDDLGGEEEG